MSTIDAVLNRVRKVTAKTTEALKIELRRVEEEKRRVTANLDEAADRLRETLRQLGHTHIGNGSGASTRRLPRGRRGKRIRRSPQQLKHEAEAIIQFVKSKGAQGVAGPEIRERHPKIGPDLKGFVRKFGGQKLKTTGVARSMRYFAS